MAERRKRPAPKKNVPSRQSSEMNPQERQFWDLEGDPKAEGTPAQKAGNLPKAEGKHAEKARNLPKAEGTPAQKIGNLPKAEGQPAKKVGNLPEAEGQPAKKVGNRPKAEGKPAEKVGSLPEIPIEKPAAPEPATTEAEDKPARETEDKPDGEAEDKLDEEEPDEEEPDEEAGDEPAKDRKTDSGESAKTGEQSESTTRKAGSDSAKSRKGTASKEESAGNKKRSKAPRSGQAEKISLAVLGVILLGVAIWGMSLFFKGIPTAPKTADIDFPVAGQFVTLKGVRTYWRRPNRDTDGGIKTDTRLIPAAMINLGASSGDGAIRVFFEDDSGKLIGDPTTLATSDGTFAENKASEAEVHATGGFQDTGEHAAYVTGQIDSWNFIIKEGPNRNASGREFKELLRVPVSVSRQ